MTLVSFGQCFRAECSVRIAEDRRQFTFIIWIPQVVE
jgi:hypothetical protein